MSSLEPLTKLLGKAAAQRAIARMSAKLQSAEAGADQISNDVEAAIPSTAEAAAATAEQVREATQKNDVYDAVDRAQQQAGAEVVQEILEVRPIHASLVAK
eukprot:GHVQ01026925.1.p2 GENE.GHVQ01026925.1~~GHVQ01026925.1.p2  ORF type:complete len:101 (+),score=16.22 GHVQ01026925.1:80-382(+)